MNHNYNSDKELEEKEEITEVNFSPALYNISSEILKLFNNCKNSANENNSISLLECIQEYTFKSSYSEEEVLDMLSEDNIFQDILHSELLKNKFIRGEELKVHQEDITDILLWSIEEE